MKVNSKFKLNMITTLSSVDFKVLTFLYQPLIGMKGLSLYNTLYMLSDNNVYEKHQMLFDLLNITQTEFIEIRNKLEAIGLMDVYEKDLDRFIYVLKPPYSAKRFLTDTFLGTYLESEIGSSNLDNLIKIFEVKKEDTTSYNNITKFFDDIYEVRSKKLLSINKELETRNGSRSLIRNSINYDLFVESLPRALKQPILLNDNFKEKVLQLAFVYQFTIEDLVKIFVESSKGKKTISIDELNLQAKIYFEANDNSLRVEEKVSDDVEILSKQSYRTIINMFGSKDLMVKANALSTINEFITQNDIDQGVLNILLIFILKNKEGVLPHVNYLNKIWSDWYKHGVRTASDAVRHREFVENQWQNKQTKNYNKPKKVNKPDWLDEYLDELGEMEG